MDVKNLKVNLEQKIIDGEKVYIFPHKNADFDAIASSLGVSLISDKLKKENHIIIGDPIYKLDHGVQSIIEEQKEEHSIIDCEQYEKERTDNSLNILCDVNKPQLLYVKEFDKDNLVIIDHHDKDNETFKASLAHIDSTASSASEIVTTLLSLYKIKIPQNIANILLTGILLDTNRLTKNVSSDTMRSVTRLLESGATMDKAGDYFTEDFNSDRKVQELVNETEFINYTIAIVQGNKDETYTKEELAKAADYLLKYKVDAAYAIGNTGDNVISISARSKHTIDVGDVMRELKGGGNPYSGGAEITDSSIEEVGDKLKKLILPNHYLGKNI